MKFDNQKTTIRIFLRKMLIAIIAAVAIVTILTTTWFDPGLLGIIKYQWILIIAGTYLLIVIISWIRGLNYLYFNDEEDKIIFRYYPIRPLGRKKKAIEIRKVYFAGFEIKNTALGLKKVLILKQYFKNKVAKYPPIGITALTKQELDTIRKRLSVYVRES